MKMTMNFIIHKEMEKIAAQQKTFLERHPYSAMAIGGALSAGVTLLDRYITARKLSKIITDMTTWEIMKNRLGRKLLAGALLGASAPLVTLGIEHLFFEK
jgi:hypothetical protein